MSKLQTKINFVERKKTSARLQESFNLKKKDCDGSPRKEITILKSPVKNSSPIKFSSPRKKCDVSSDIFSDKENQTCVNLKCKKNPNNISPAKKAQERTVEPVNGTYQLRSSPLKRSTVDTNKSGCGVSPPKRQLTQEQTPSQLINKLILNSPEQPKNSQPRRELFPKGEFDEACKALHSAAPTKLPGREDKLTCIKEFLSNHANDQTSGTLYISGPPGTGKTASVNLATADPHIAEYYKIVCLNCTSMNTTGSIYRRIVTELKLKMVGHSEKAALLAIEKNLGLKKRKMILIVLDELDQLCTSKQSVLYSIFEWPSRPHARIVLVGIANALDLTDRVLPRLQARLTLQPTVIHFPSYSRQQIIDIIVDRLQQAGVEEVLSGPTLQLLAGKVAAVNGDVRRALDIARRVVEVAEKRTVLQPISDNVLPKQSVMLQEVLMVVNDVYNTAQSLDSSEDNGFPLQQKLLICSLLLLRQSTKAKDITIGKLHEVYKKVCERRNMSAVDISEFISLTSLVESRGILRVSGKNHNRLSKVILQWDENEVKTTLQDKQLLAEVLSDRGVVA